MQNRNCKKCGKVFRYITGYPLCDECKVIDEDEFLKVREHIKLNPGINIEEAFTRIEQNRTNIKEDFIFPVNKPDHETSILQHSQPQKNPNQYMPQVDFNKNLDIPAFLRKRIQITQ